MSKSRAEGYAISIGWLAAAKITDRRRSAKHTTNKVLAETYLLEIAAFIREQEATKQKLIKASEKALSLIEESGKIDWDDVVVPPLKKAIDKAKP